MANIIQTRYYFHGESHSHLTASRDDSTTSHRAPRLLLFLFIRRRGVAQAIKLFLGELNQNAASRRNFTTTTTCVLIKPNIYSSRRIIQQHAASRDYFTATHRTSQLFFLFIFIRSGNTTRDEMTCYLLKSSINKTIL